VPNWKEILGEINNTKNAHLGASNAASDLVRRNYLQKLQAHTGRNVIAYYSGWLSKPRVTSIDTSINDEDKNGFMMAVHQMTKSDGLDLLLHTPGGGMGATESIVFYLRQIFGRDIRAFVPQIAMSAGTMIACSCKEIWMGKHSSLGPIDPQMAGLPALAVKKEFQRAYQEIKKEPKKLAVWEPILRKYSPTFLTQCESAVKWGEQFVAEQLKDVMLFRKKNKTQRAQKIVTRLSDYDENKAHARHIHYDAARSAGLVVKLLEDDKPLQDLVLTVHHCYMHALQNTSAFKIIENHLGAAVVKQISISPQILQQQPIGL
jgi:ClpP class serine protease